MINRRRMTIREFAYAAVICALLAIMGWMLATAEPAGKTSTPATPAPELRGEIKRSIKVESVKAYRPAIKARMNLPDHIVKDDTKQVIAASKVKPSEHPITLTTIIDTDTGEATQYEREDPLPWLASNTTTEVNVALLNGTHGPFMRADVRQELFQVKSVHFSGVVTGSVPFSGQGRNEAAAGVVMTLRF